MPQIKSPVTNTLLISFVLVFVVSPIPVNPPWSAMPLRATEFFSGSFWQPVTYIFLHGGFLHLFFNGLGIWSLGRIIESVMGSVAFAQLFFVAGIAGGLTVAILQPGSDIPTVGASGSLLGLLGALGLIFPNARLLVFVFPMRAITAVYAIGAISAVFQILFMSGQLTGFLSMISHSGHLGGLVGGFIFTRLWIRRNQARLEEYKTPDFWQTVRDRFGQGEDAWREPDPDGSDGTFQGDGQERFGGRGRPVRPSRFKSIYYNPETGRFEVRE